VWDCALVLPVSDVFGVVDVTVTDEDTQGKYACLGCIQVCVGLFFRPRLSI